MAGRTLRLLGSSPPCCAAASWGALLSCCLIESITIKAIKAVSLVEPIGRRRSRSEVIGR
eukprot:2823332-Prymnesium_polylepis.1